MNERKSIWKKEWIGGRMNKRKYDWEDELMKGRMNESEWERWLIRESLIGIKSKWNGEWMRRRVIER